MNISTKEKTKKTIKLLKDTLNGLNALDYPIGKIRFIYSELWVATKLWNLKPQIGNKRKHKSADIYLEEIDKSIEVKGCGKDEMTGYADWLWTFGTNQINHKKFDYAVLLGYKENSCEIEKVFVMSFEELKELKEYSERKGLLTKGSTYISFVESPKDYNEAINNGEIEHIKIEEELNKHPKKFEKKWDKIK